MSAPETRHWEGTSTSDRQTEALGAAVARHARAGDVVALIGELGAGKTRFVRGMASAMGAGDAPVASPTFVLVHAYETGDTFPGLVHVDAYRLHGPGDLESIGWDGAFGSREMRRDAVIVVEWADRVGDLGTQDVLELRLQHAGESERVVSVTAGGSWASRIGELVASLNAALAPGATTPCPICKSPVAPQSEYAPFCSARCRTIDLGKWISGEYLISRPLEQTDLEE